MTPTASSQVQTISNIAADLFFVELKHQEHFTRISRVSILYMTDVCLNGLLRANQVTDEKKELNTHKKQWLWEKIGHIVMMAADPYLSACKCTTSDGTTSDGTQG